MMRKYDFRKQVNNRGCYAGILFDVNIINESSNDVVINYLADSRWEVACRAGILIFQEYFNRKMNGSLEVTIHEIKWIPIDTNNLIVLYASIGALCEAFNLRIEKFSFDASNEIFLFPEVRSL